MSINVIMPQMGESIFEGTITKWLKKIGDRVSRDEPLFEISTDKVDSEIPSPADGTLSRILVAENQIAKVGHPVAILEAEEAVTTRETTAADVGEAGGSVEAPDAEARVEEPTLEPMQATAVAGPVPVLEQGGGAGEALQKAAVIGAGTLEAEPQAATAEEVARVAELKSEEVEMPKTGPQPVRGEESPRSVRTSPLVRRIAHEYGVNLSEIEGTGLSGRITREDIFSHLKRHGKMEARPAMSAPEVAAVVEAPQSSAPPRVAAEARSHAPVIPPPKIAAAPEKAEPPREEPAPAPPDEVSKFPGETGMLTMSPMRKAIAERMVLSKRTSAHVQTLFEVDMTSIVQLRERHKDEFEARVGIKLSYTPFFVKALVDTVRDFPIMNCSVSGDKIIFKKPINVGVAVSLDTGLIVPVIRDAHLKSFTGLALAIHDIAERARTRRLKPEEVQHGTITITNPGIYGSLFGTPIINQPQVAILGVGSLEKRPVIIGDAIAIRTMVYVVLSFDHRVIDGAVADRFMAALKSRLQSWNQWVE
jgi:2-oxoglutarate dehydrogenase E2 component (dihydrolipoamide succinyltransferase)